MCYISCLRSISIFTLQLQAQPSEMPETQNLWEFFHRFALNTHHGFDNIIGPSHFPRPLPCGHTLPVFINKRDNILWEQETSVWAPPGWHQHWGEPSPEQPNLILGEHGFGVLVLRPRLPRQVGQSTKAHLLQIWETEQPRWEDQTLLYTATTLGNCKTSQILSSALPETVKPPSEISSKTFLEATHGCKYRILGYFS